MKKQILTCIISIFIYLSGITQSSEVPACTQCLETSVTGSGASAIGINTGASGQASLAGGTGSVASGTNSLSFGNNTIAGNSSTVALGHAAEATGISAFSAGHSAKAYGDYSVALGIGTSTNGYRSTAIGFNAYAGNVNGFALGTQVKSLSQNSFVFGTGYNTSYLENNIPNSLKIGFGSTKHTVFVGTAPTQDKTGKVAIGDLTDPQAKLHIKTDMHEFAALRLEPWSWTASNYTEMEFGDNNNRIRVTCSSGFGFYTPNNYVFNTGKVGIGITPTEKLHVNGNIKLTEGYYVGADKIKAVGESGLYLHNHADAGIFVSPAGNVGIGTTSAQQRLTVNGSILAGANAFIAGNVGIGTDSPQQKLHVAGNQLLTGTMQVQGASYLNGIVLNDDTDITGVDRIVGYNDLRLWGDASGGTDLIITAGGNVGIGTEAPAAKLDVNGAIKTSGFQLSSGAGAGKLLQSDASGNATWANPAWTISGSNVFRTSGNVGIGTSAPSEKLEVNGNIKAGSVIATSMNIDNFTINTLTVTQKLWAGEIEVTNLSEWKDHVFNEDYPLRSLGEVEAFIRTHGHLPDIPSEKEVLENGFNVGEMNALLLQKIEELTLYVIELEKKVATINTDRK